MIPKMPLATIGGAFRRSTVTDPAQIATIGKRLGDALPGERFRPVLESTDRLLPEVVLGTDEFEVSSFDGKGRFLVNVEPLFEEGEVVGHLPGVALAREITGRKRVEDELRTVSESFESAFKSAPIGMALVGLDGRAQRVNKALVDFLGYGQRKGQPAGGTLHGRPRRDHPSRRHRGRSRAGRPPDRRPDRALRTGEAVFFARDVVAAASVWALLAVSLVRDEDGTPLYFISQIKDITNRKQVEADLRRVAFMPKTP